MLDAVPARCVFVDREHRYRWVNREFLDFVGRDAEAVIGRHVAEVLGPELYERYRPAVASLEAGETLRWEGWIAYPHRGRRFVQETLTPHLVDGRVEGVLAFARDLTTLKEREGELAERLDALRRSEALHAAVVSAALDCVIVIDEAGLVLEFNPAAETTFGVPREAALGQPIGDIIVPHHLRARHAAGFARYIRTGERRVLGRRIEIEALRADGTIFPVELTITEVQLPDRRLFTAHLRDLTGPKAAAAEIEAQRGRIHQIEKLSAMGSLLAGVAHELNTPLAILLAQAALLKEKAPTDDVKKRAERIHAAAERSGRIVKSFVAMARQKPPQREPTDLHEVIRASAEITAYGRRSAGIELHLDLSPTPPVISADRDLLGQVVANLLLNAHQVLLDRAPPRAIWLATRLIPEGVEVTVADNGPGVPEALKERIFEPYFTTKPVGAGTGIGLSISRSVVDSHGGAINVGERPGGGALFRIVLPIGEGAGPAGDEAEAEDGPGLSVLVVDDELDVGQSLAEILQDLGHRAQVLGSPQEALDLLERRRFDLVFVDLRMPGLSGVELRQRIAARDPALAERTVIVTGDTVAGPGAVSRRAGEAEVVVLEKPFTVADVRGALVRVLGW
jgi:PAS domain S-box-containing protein